MDLVETSWTVEQFLAWEARQEQKHEFDGQRIVPMTGGSLSHQWIVFNLMAALLARLAGAEFTVVQEMRLRFGRRVRYPDVVVVAGAIGQTVRTLAEAMVLFEVLSDDTAAIDLTDKRREYASVPGARRYVILAQDRIAATSLRREGEDWAEEQAGPDGVALPELGIVLPFAEIYARLSF